MWICASPALAAVVRDRCQCLEVWHVSFHQFCTQDLRCKALLYGMHPAKRVGRRSLATSPGCMREDKKCLCHIRALSTINKIGVDIGGFNHGALLTPDVYFSRDHGSGTGKSPVGKYTTSRYQHLVYQLRASL